MIRGVNIQNYLSQPLPLNQCYCWWLKSCTTWDVWNPINNGKNYLSTGAGFQPSTVGQLEATNCWDGTQNQQKKPKIDTRPSRKSNQSSANKNVHCQQTNVAASHPPKIKMRSPSFTYKIGISSSNSLMIRFPFVLNFRGVPYEGALML